MPDPIEHIAIENQTDEHRIFFYAKTHDFKKALDLYAKKNKEHNPHLLIRLAKSLLEEGLHHKEAYRYLTSSILAFDLDDILKKLESLGFVEITTTTKTFGLATIIKAKKPS